MRSNCQSRVRETVAKWQFDKFQFFDSKDKDDSKFDTQGFIAANDKAVLVAFRGTENFTDWRTNVKFKPENGPVGKLHRGFYRAAQRAWDDCIAPAISEFRNNEQSLWICGHSLRDALALATATLLEFGPDASIKPKAVYTFGQPRVGNREFARAFNEFKNTHRVFLDLYIVICGAMGVLLMHTAPYSITTGSAHRS